MTTACKLLRTRDLRLPHQIAGFGFDIGDEADTEFANVRTINYDTIWFNQSVTSTVTLNYVLSTVVAREGGMNCYVRKAGGGFRLALTTYESIDDKESLGCNDV